VLSVRRQRARRREQRQGAGHGGWVLGQG
jgi:hypothetical protein